MRKTLTWCSTAGTSNSLIIYQLLAASRLKRAAAYTDKETKNVTGKRYC